MIAEPDEPQSPRPRPPRWALRADATLVEASARVRVIAANTPANLREELARLTEAWDTTGPEGPRFAYEPLPACGQLRGALEQLANDLEPRGELGALYAGRARELADDAALCDAAGTAELWGAARRRYARRDRFDDAADVAAASWLEEAPAAETDVELVRSDDERSPRSLLSRMREEIGRRRLPLRVVVKHNIASLAATGEGFVQVAGGRDLGERDVERTVMHEIEGHAEPRIRAARASIGLFALGTARGTDDQEGRALWLERSRGFLDHFRRREIALRHTAARAVEARADFVSTVRELRLRGAPLEAALRISARAHRGGGLGREIVYLPAFLRVEAALERDREVDRVLGAGRVSVEAAPALGEWIWRSATTFALALALTGCAPAPARSPAQAPVTGSPSVPRCTPADRRAALDAFVTANEARYATALDRARAFLDGLEVDPIKLRAARIKGKKKLVEALDAYHQLWLVAEPAARPALLARVEVLARPTRDAAYHDLETIGARELKEDATSYLRAALLLDRMGFDGRYYRERILAAKPRLDAHMKERGPHQRRTFHAYYRHFGLREPFELASALEHGLIARRADPEHLSRMDVYAVTHEIFAAVEYGEKLHADSFSDADRAYLEVALSRLLEIWRERRDVDLVAELVTSARYAEVQATPSYLVGLATLLDAQNANGSFGSYEHLRSRIVGGLVEQSHYLHTTMVVIEALTLAFAPRFRAQERPACWPS